jgi:hypothetical protein
MDTLYGATTLLTALEQQVPGITKSWVNGGFTFAELGDDIIFTLPKQLDVERFAKDAKQICGADLEVLENDALFLKTMLPLLPVIQHVCKPVSRLLQQTLFNEDSYEGKGGVTPDAILRLGLMARADHFNWHPLAADLLDVVTPPILSLGFVERSSTTYKANVRKGIFKLDEGDEEAIQLYASRNPFYVDDLVDKAKYMASAADTLKLLADVGIAIGMSRDSLALRKLYVKAFFQDPNETDVRKVHDLMTWVR